MARRQRPWLEPGGQRRGSEEEGAPGQRKRERVSSQRHQGRKAEEEGEGKLKATDAQIPQQLQKRQSKLEVVK